MSSVLACLCVGRRKRDLSPTGKSDGQGIPSTAQRTQGCSADDGGKDHLCRVSRQASTHTVDSFDLPPEAEASDPNVVLDDGVERLINSSRKLASGQKELNVLLTLGNGPKGIVYKGTLKRTPVVIRSVSLQGTASELAKLKDTLTVELSRRVSHPNIVSPIKFDMTAVVLPENNADDRSVSTNAKLCIVQEYCEGNSLRRAIDNRMFFSAVQCGPSLGKVLQAALDIACALSCLHSRNIIHGGLCPSNVLLKENERCELGYVAKVKDYSIGRLNANREKVKNTAFYQAPEVEALGGTKPSDAFSYGVILLELLYGTPPWRSERRRGSGQTMEVRPLLNLMLQGHKNVPLELTQLIKWCVSDAPDLRPKFAEIVTLLMRLHKAWCTGGLRHYVLDPGSLTSEAVANPRFRMNIKQESIENGARYNPHDVSSSVSGSSRSNVSSCTSFVSSNFSNSSLHTMAMHKSYAGNDLPYPMRVQFSPGVQGARG